MRDRAGPGRINPVMPPPRQQNEKRPAYRRFVRVQSGRKCVQGNNSVNKPFLELGGQAAGPGYERLVLWDTLLRLPERTIQLRNMAAYPRASESVRSCSTVKRIFLPQFGYCQVVAGRFC